MSWNDVQNSSLETLAWVVRLGIIFGVLGFLMPCNRGMFWWKNWRSTLTDFFYWFVAPLCAAVVHVYLLNFGTTLLFGGGKPGFEAFRTLPVWLQCVGVMLLLDIGQYWIHRGFHTRFAWSFHAIHHSPTTVDWMSAGRFHLVNSVVSSVLMNVLAVLLLGPGTPVTILVVFNIYYSAMVHANLNWTFGPLRFVFASPVFHRWHHTTEEAGLNKNFAPTFPFLDLLFGTFHMPADELPQEFGNGEEDFPESFWGQLVYPFFWRNAKPTAEMAAPVVASMRVKVKWSAERQPAPDRVAEKKKRLKAG